MSFIERADWDTESQTEKMLHREEGRELGDPRKAKIARTPPEVRVQTRNRFSHSPQKEPRLPTP